MTCSQCPLQGYDVYWGVGNTRMGVCSATVGYRFEPGPFEPNRFFGDVCLALSTHTRQPHAHVHIWCYFSSTNLQFIFLTGPNLTRDCAGPRWSHSFQARRSNHVQPTAGSDSLVEELWSARLVTSWHQVLGRTFFAFFHFQHKAFQGLFSWEAMHFVSMVTWPAIAAKAGENLENFWHQIEGETWQMFTDGPRYIRSTDCFALLLLSLQPLLWRLLHPTGVLMSLQASQFSMFFQNTKQPTQSVFVRLWVRWLAVLWTFVSIEVGWTVAAWVNPAVEPFWATIVAKYDQLNWEA